MYFVNNAEDHCLQNSKTVDGCWVFCFFLLFSSFSINLAHLNKQHRLTKVFYKVKKKKSAV